jgi:hypothetical protein
VQIRFAIVMVFVLLGCTAGFAGENPVVGKWDCVSNGGGEDLHWTLVVKEEAGKLSGSLVLEQGAIEIADAKLEGKDFSFSIVINGNSYKVESKIDGTKIEGKFKGEDASGWVKGTKQG